MYYYIILYVATVVVNAMLLFRNWCCGTCFVAAAIVYNVLLITEVGFDLL